MGLSQTIHNNYKRYNHLTDEDLIDRVLNGEKQMFGVVLRRNSQKLYNTSYSILRNTDDVKDALQLTYVKAYEKLGQFKRSSVFGTWLTRIAINESLKKLKNNIKTADRVIIDPDTLKADGYSSYMDELSNPEYTAIRCETREILNQAIDSLPYIYRTVFEMRAVDGYNIEETANTLNLTPVNVKVRLSRAKSILRDLLRKQLIVEELMSHGQDIY